MASGVTSFEDLRANQLDDEKEGGLGQIHRAVRLGPAIWGALLARKKKLLNGAQA